jgi:spore maturation protein CgeB
MRIVYAGMKYDYGDPARGLSFEHTNIYDSLAHMGHEIIYFDFMHEFQISGRDTTSRRLVDLVRAEKPELLLCVLFTDQLNVDAVAGISRSSDTVTFNWFCDDQWRFESYSRYWAPAFNWVSTTATSALPKYEALGYRNVIKTQWACNHFLYKKLDLPLLYEVTFVGQPHGDRRAVIRSIERAGIRVQAWGHGWPQGRLNQEQMIETFNQSRINLNLSNSSTTTSRFALRRWLVRKRSSASELSQIKGRNFEVPGCGGFLLTDPAENLEAYYAPGREIGTFCRPAELVETIRYYLDHEDQRRAIAAAGYQRTAAEHTYERRFNEIFSCMGLQ